MVIIAIAVLFIIQLISFYVIVLLNSKIAKFKDLEVRQDKLIREMDDVIGVYLLEMREENDRLIKELTVSSVRPKQSEMPQESRSWQQVELGNELGGPSVTSEQIPTVETPSLEQRTFVPKNIAANAYNRQKKQIQPVVKEQEQEPPIQTPSLKELPSFEKQVVQYFNEGMTIEEIAKKTQKGKTEIELVIKFHA
ncbi:hypothetical protein [Solibacillus sp. FSL H8-0538]|uniref:hypothetical protein n=1 Tax=Solibacillus sp. FSL H8-0538 TaxID=2921400 RepID=UPI0030F92A18